jgi:hypothetical protein
MGTRADGVRVAYPLFQGEGSGSTPTSALQLWFWQTDLKTARDLTKLWHSRLPRIDQRVAGWVCYSAEHECLFFAAAIWGLPISNGLPQDFSCLELRRLSIAPDAPRNTASRMLGWMVRDIRRRFPRCERLVSYQDVDVHTGSIYRAAGWVPTVRVKFTSWKHHLRPSRGPDQSTADKQRWEKTLTGAGR